MRVNAEGIKSHERFDRWTLKAFKIGMKVRLEQRAITRAVIKVSNELAVYKNETRRFWHLQGGESTSFLRVARFTSLQVILRSGANEFTIDTLIAIERAISRAGKG